MVRSNEDSKNGKMARTGAQVGAQIGARTGSKFGPFATGIASGLGGATGFLAGTVVDGVLNPSSGKLRPDGGMEQQHDDDSVRIDVVGPDDSEDGTDRR